MHASTSFCQYSICCSATWARRVWSEGSPKALSFIPTSSWHFSCSGVHSRPRREDVARSGGFKLKVRKTHPEKFFPFQVVSGCGSGVGDLSRLLQFLPRPSNAARDARDGSGAK